MTVAGGLQGSADKAAGLPSWAQLVGWSTIVGTLIIGGRPSGREGATPRLGEDARGHPTRVIAQRALDQAGDQRSTPGIGPSCRLTSMCVAVVAFDFTTLRGARRA